MSKIYQLKLFIHACEFGKKPFSVEIEKSDVNDILIQGSPLMRGTESLVKVLYILTS